MYYSKSLIYNISISLYNAKQKTSFYQENFWKVMQVKQA